MTRQATRMFGIDTVADYLAFCETAVTELESDQDNVLRGFAAILALNHIPDWLQYKLTSAERSALGLVGSKTGDSVKCHFEAKNVDLRRIRDVANGFKHLRPTHPTKVIAGYGEGPFGIGPYGVPYLLIDLGEEQEASERWDVGLSLCKRTLEWWRTELSNLQLRGERQ